MTLNITLAARWGIVQSSDFRLTAPSSGRILSNAAQKQIVLHYTNWSGLLSYTGIATWNDHDTNEWLTKVLVHEPGNRSIEQVVTRLAADMKTWLEKIPTKHRYHTFTLCTYRKHISRIFVISTHQRAGGPDLTPTGEILISNMRPRTPRTLITGQHQAVATQWIDGLVQEISRKPNMKRLRRLVAETNRRTSKALESDDNHSVSESCVVSHLLPDGSGEFEVFGKPPKPFLPTMLIMGSNTAPEFRSSASQLNFNEPMWLHGATWNRNGEIAALLGAMRKMSNDTAPVWRTDD